MTVSAPMLTPERVRAASTSPPPAPRKPTKRKLFGSDSDGDGDSATSPSLRALPDCVVRRGPKRHRRATPWPAYNEVLRAAAETRATNAPPPLVFASVSPGRTSGPISTDVSVLLTPPIVPTTPVFHTDDPQPMPDTDMTELSLISGNVQYSATGSKAPAIISEQHHSPDEAVRSPEQANVEVPITYPEAFDVDPPEPSPGAVPFVATSDLAASNVEAAEVAATIASQLSQDNAGFEEIEDAEEYLCMESKAVAALPPIPMSQDLLRRRQQFGGIEKKRGGPIRRALSSVWSRLSPLGGLRRGNCSRAVTISHPYSRRTTTQRKHWTAHISENPASLTLAAMSARYVLSAAPIVAAQRWAAGDTLSMAVDGLLPLMEPFAAAGVAALAKNCLTSLCEKAAPSMALICGPSDDSDDEEAIGPSLTLESRSLMIDAIPPSE